VFLVVSKSSMKRAFDLLGGNEKLFWFLEVSRKWDTLDTWLKDLVFPSALQGTVVVMDYYSPVGRMKLLSCQECLRGKPDRLPLFLILFDF